jgi:hypothetical protein
MSIGFSFFLSARRSFISAIFCNWRMRSRVTPNFLADFFERLRFAAIEAEAREDDLSSHDHRARREVADFIAQDSVAQLLKRRLRFHVADDLAELGRIVVADRRVERSRAIETS